MTTYVQTVASDVCGPLPPTVPVNIDCSLCAIGFPQAGGTIGVSFYGPICPPSTTPSPSYWLGPATKYAPFSCPNPGQDTELDPNTWVAEAPFAGITTGGCANQYKFRAVLVALNEYQISVSVTVYVLTPTVGGNYWATYLSWSETLTEIVNLDTTRYRGRAFASPTYQSVTPASIGGVGDPVMYAKMIVGLQSMRLGCGSVAYALPDCGFWNGTRWLTCLRGEIQSLGNTDIREFTQLGFNVAGCGAVGASYCQCDNFTLDTVAPPTGTALRNADPQFITDYGVLGIAGAVEAVGVEQEIQIAAATTCGIQVAVKEIGGTVYICTNDNGAGWVCSTAVQAQANSPHILTATRATFEVYLYAMQFPNPEILAESCGDGGEYPTPDPETDPWWCVDGVGCVQSRLQPEDTIGGPYASLALCSAACDAQVGEYWCWYGYCYQSETQPPGSTGPYLDAAACAEECGPPEMVWHCGEDSGCALIARYEAELLGYTYYFSQAECEENCTSAWWCTPEGCVQWWGGGTPPGATSGPYATLVACEASCDTGPGYYCVGGVCAFYSSAPPGATAGPYATFLECSVNCGEGFSQPAPQQEPAFQPLGATKLMEPARRAKLLERVKLLQVAPCQFLGPPVEAVPSCGCSGGLMHACAVFGTCRTKGPDWNGIPSCWNCEKDPRANLAG